MADVQHAGDYRIISFLIYSYKHDNPIDIVAHVDEIEIYENIGLPFLTGNFLMKDDMRFYDGVSINGTEMIEITLESPENVGVQILKRFTISEVVVATKTTNNIEVLKIKIVENNYFNNNLMKINKTYTGTPDIIVQNILRDNLGIEMELPVIKPFQQLMKIVVPYQTPFDACAWVCSMMSTELGLPYFLFATLNDDNLQLKSLEEMLRNPAWNKASPYRFSSAYNQTTTSIKADENAFNVGAYSGYHKEDTMTLMERGATAGLRSITDMTTGQNIDYHFDVDTLFQELSEMEIIDRDHEPVFHAKYVFNGKSMNEYNTFHSHIVVANKTYGNKFNNIYEETSIGAYRLHSCRSALLRMIMKSSINIRVPGRMYMTGHNASIGRQIDFIYPANNSNIENQASASDQDQIDKKRSGTYIIYTARHHFNQRQHNVDMSCVKLGNRK